jgi:hypothetical protein
MIGNKNTVQFFRQYPVFQSLYGFVREEVINKGMFVFLSAEMMYCYV